jgi:hypothetical protein
MRGLSPLRRRATVIGTIAVTAGLLAAAPAAVASTLAKSKFDSTVFGAEGWKQAVVPAAPADATWASTGGNPGGAIVQTLYDMPAYYFYWQAPVAFLNHKVAAYKGTLEFDQYFGSPDLSTPRDIIVYLLDKNETGLVYTRAGGQPNNFAFTHHQIPLSKTGWYVYPNPDVPASGDQLKHALGHLAELDIETYDAIGTCQGNGLFHCTYMLDNVKLKTP